MKKRPENLPFVCPLASQMARFLSRICPTERGPHIVHLKVCSGPLVLPSAWAQPRDLLSRT